MPLDASELYTGFSPIRASHVKQFFDLLTGITTDQAVQLKNGLTVTNGLTMASGTAALLATTATTLAATGLITATGGQIGFPATQAASAGANVLDDYEEGTWTPALSTPGSATYTTQTGIYTKVGRTVTVSCYLAINAIGTGSATSSITGLPFTIGNYAGSGVAYWTAAASTLVALTALLQPGGTSIIPCGAAAATATITPNPTLWANTTNFIWSGDYSV